MYEGFDRLISFVSVYQALRAEKLLTKAGLAIMSAPTPREIDVSCGQCLLFGAADEPEILRILRQEQVVWSKLFKRDATVRVYEKMKDFEG